MVTPGGLRRVVTPGGYVVWLHRGATSCGYTGGLRRVVTPEDCVVWLHRELRPVVTPGTASWVTDGSSPSDLGDERLYY